MDTGSDKRKDGNMKKQIVILLIAAVLLFSACAPQGAAGEEQGMGALFANVFMFVPIIAIFYFMLIRPQRKREKKVQEMRSRVEVGDEVVTAGGIIGRVVSIKDDTLVIETSSERSKIRIARWAIHSNNTVHDDTPEK